MPTDRPRIRFLAFLPLLILAAAAALILLLIAASDPDVTTRFATVQEARSKGAFERGWLPPVLPESARNIVETNDLDVNQGHGTFEFDASDYLPFTAKLTPVEPQAASPEWDAYTAKGCRVFSYQARWTLALHPRGDGYYTVR